MIPGVSGKIGAYNRECSAVLVTPRARHPGVDPEMRPKSIPALSDRQQERFWAKVDVPGQPSCCWEWTGRVDGRGYGHWSLAAVGGLRAHRVAYTLLVGAIPDGLVIDHVCRNVRCVNPDHLAPVTPRENALRGFAPMVRQSRIGECVAGHQLTPENTYLKPSGHRECRLCRAAGREAFNRRRSASAIARRQTLPCRRCGTMFVKTHGMQTFCCAECQIIAKREAQRARDRASRLRAALAREGNRCG